MAFVTTGFITFVTFFWSILPLVAVLDLIGVLTILFVDRLDPRSFVFWLMVIIIFPIGGLLLYFALGNNFYSDRYFRRKMEKDMPFMDEPVHMDGEDVFSLKWTDKEFKDSMLEDLAQARESVWIQSPMIPGNSVWNEIMYEVIELAAKGLDVKVMTTHFGFGRSHGVLRLLRAGGRICTFSNSIYASTYKRYRNRNLRMQVIIDGAVVYTGAGCFMRIEGPMVTNHKRRFVLDWAHGAWDDREHVPVATMEGKALMVEDGRDIPDAGRSLEFLLSVAHTAKDTLYICMPYLTPDEDMHNTLKLCAYSGTDVRLILPAKTWYAPQKWNSLVAAYPLMKSGVRVYFLDGMSDKRILVSDDRYCMVGSATMSRKTLDMDLNLSTVVESKEVCQHAREMFLRELDNAVECTPAEVEDMSFWDRIRVMGSRFCMYMN